jgi:hypothetical protein
MHLLILDDHTGPKIVVLVPANMARLQPSMVTKIFLGSKHASLLAGAKPTLNIQGKSSIFDQNLSF